MLIFEIALGVFLGIFIIPAVFQAALSWIADPYHPVLEGMFGFAERFVSRLPRWMTAGFFVIGVVLLLSGAGAGLLKHFDHGLTFAMEGTCALAISGAIAVIWGRKHLTQKDYGILAAIVTITVVILSVATHYSERLPSNQRVAPVPTHRVNSGLQVS
jgi:hypothetical protein